MKNKVSRWVRGSRGRWRAEKGPL